MRAPKAGPRPGRSGLVLALLPVLIALAAATAPSPSTAQVPSGTPAMAVGGPMRIAPLPPLPPGFAPTGVRVRAYAPEVDAAAGATSPALDRLLLTALVPGTGQLLEGRGRGWVLLGADLLAVGGWWFERSAGHDDADAYRELAWRVARGGAGRVIGGEFEYYERMAKWTRSGAFDAVPNAPGIQPETRLDTFNGDAWRLARNLFLEGGEGTPGSPEWDAAVAWYAERAYAGDRRWDWSDAPDERAAFRALIDRSDDHLRRAGWAATVAIGLRVVSVIDLFVAERSDGRLRLRAHPTPNRGIDTYFRLTTY